LATFWAIWAILGQFSFDFGDILGDLVLWILKFRKRKEKQEQAFALWLTEQSL
jgi:hypothetical protein